MVTRNVFLLCAGFLGFTHPQQCASQFVGNTGSPSAVCNVGDVVVATYEPNGRRYPAKISAFLGDEFVMVDWDDGDEEYRLMEIGKVWTPDRLYRCSMAPSDANSPTKKGKNGNRRRKKQEQAKREQMQAAANARDTTTVNNNSGQRVIFDGVEYTYTPPVTDAQSSFSPPQSSSSAGGTYSGGGLLSYVSDYFYNVGAAQEEETNKKNSDYVFDQSALRSYNLVIDPVARATLDADPTAEEYVQCAMETEYGTAEVKRWEGAGCRYKGSVGSLRVCVDETTNQPIDGACRKLSIKVNSDKFLKDKKQEIFGMERFLFHGMAVDYALMSERIAYNTMQDMLLRAPRSTHALLYINGVFDGIYSLVEDIDDEFTKRHFKDDLNEGKGGLYKELWFNNEMSSDVFDSKFEDGKDEEPFLREIITALAAAQETEQSAQQVLSRYFDVKTLADVIAINTLVGMTDDWRMRHNFYWYVHQAPRDDFIYMNDPPGPHRGKRLVMIPWDYDRLNDGSDRLVAGAPKDWYEVISKNNPLCLVHDPTPHERALTHTSYGTGEYWHWLDIYKLLPERVEIPIQCDKMARLIALGLRSTTLNRIIELADTVATEDAYLTKLREYSSTLESLVNVDPDPPQEQEWKTEVEKLYTHLITNRANVVENARQGLRRGLVSNPNDPSSFPSSLPFTFSTAGSGSNSNSFSSSSTAGETPMFSTASRPPADTSTFTTPATLNFGSLFASSSGTTNSISATTPSFMTSSASSTLPSFESSGYSGLSLSSSSLPSLSGSSSSSSFSTPSLLSSSSLSSLTQPTTYASATSLMQSNTYASSAATTPSSYQFQTATTSSSNYPFTTTSTGTSYMPSISTSGGYLSTTTGSSAYQPLRSTGTPGSLTSFNNRG